MSCLFKTSKENVHCANVFQKFLFALGILSLVFIPSSSSALFDINSHVSDAKLLSSVQGEGNEVVIWVGLDIHMQPGWDTYWRTPGASGYGLKINWSGSKNLKSAEVYWPAPTKFETFKITANGYKEDVVIPIKITLKKAHESLLLNAKLDYLVCDPGNCVPQDKTVTLLVPDGPNIPSMDASKISTAIQHIPEKSNPNLEIKSAQFIHNEDSESYLRLIVFHTMPLTSPELFVEGGKQAFFDGVRSISTTPKNGGNISTLDIPIYKNVQKEPGHTENFVGKSLTLTLENGNVSIEKTVKVTAPPIGIKSTVIMYGVALLGGFILNFMPCVLPVILLKVFSLTKYGGKSTRSVRHALFLSVMGIISSFLILGLIPICLNLVGISFGWGMQFQEPIFLVFMMLVLTLFTANFWGFYEIILPEKIATAGYQYSDKQGNAGHFLSGMFTTLLATPCSAPYLGTAVTFALSRGPFEILLVFFFLGLGLSLPFILVILFPEMATYLPKPGKWMGTFKKILGWGFFFTMLWLFYVLTSQVSLLTSLLILVALLSILFIFWLRYKFPDHGRIYASTISLLVLLPILSASYEYIKKTNAPPPPMNMQMLSSTIKADLKAQRVVIVDVTADWCLTCKVNEVLVLNTEHMKNLIKTNNVDFIKIDWTSRAPQVYEYLKSFNRNGIPFYVVYGPHLPYGQVLPQILTLPTMDNVIMKAKQNT